ncbi:hypothetical protein [Streptomyces sp. AB3(2024)]|uniref:hypothetical protein n=1 Tax=Streptomyces sp. AB3(2024) TaxID=3317321 RepID=UPI0035A364FD
MLTRNAKKQLAVSAALLSAALVAAGASSGSSSPSLATSSSASSSPTPNPPTPNPEVAKKYPGCDAHLHDGDKAKTTTFSNLRGVQYAEVSLVCGPGVATMYNTTFMNNPKNPTTPDLNLKESAPLALWNSFSQDSVALDYSVPNVLKNGPRFWVNDWIKLPVGPTLYFSGIYARWFANPQYAPDISKIFGNPKFAYKETTVERSSTIGFNAGTKIFVLVDPDNNPYIMQAGSSQFDATENIQTLTQPDFASKLHLPSGWQYKVITITKPLTIQSVNGKATVLTDYLANTYDSCTSPSTAACSYNPLTGQ